jgi:hypothetical protein
MMMNHPNNNKQPRTKSFEHDLCNLIESQGLIHENPVENSNLIKNKQLTSSNQEWDFPPISLKFRNRPQLTGR